MRIDSSGNVGIGTTSLGAKLSISGGSLPNPDIGDVGISGRLTTGRTGVFDGGSLGSISSAADVASYEISCGSTSGYVSGISVTGNYATNYKGTVRFITGSSERMRIDASGNLLVGTTSGSSKFNLSYVYPQTGGSLTSNVSVSHYAFTFNNTNGLVGSITTDASATSYNTSSDYRLKENIKPMQNALGVVAQLNPVTYNWKADGSDGQGFIAHELQAIVPDCVTGEKDAVDDEGKPVYQGIDTSFLVATLTKAIQEQQEQINQLKAEVAALKGA